MPINGMDGMNLDLGLGVDNQPMAPPAPPMGGPPTPNVRAPGMPGPGTSPIIPPGFNQNPQQLMQQIMQMIIGEQLRKFFGGGTGGQPSTFTPGGGWFQPPMPQAPPGMAIPQVMPQPQWAMGDQQIPQGWTPTQAPMPPILASAQGPQGMMQGPMSWLTQGMNPQLLNMLLQTSMGGSTGLMRSPNPMLMTG